MLKGCIHYSLYNVGIVTTLTGLVIVCMDYKIPKTAAKYILVEKPFVKEDVFTREQRKSIASLPQLKVSMIVFYLSQEKKPHPNM